MAPSVLDEMSLEPDKVIDIHIEPEVFKTFDGIEDDAIPLQMQHIFHKPDQE